MLDALWFAFGLLIGWLIWVKFPKVGEKITVAYHVIVSNVAAWFASLSKKE